MASRAVATRDVVRITLTVVAVLAALYLTWRVRNVLFLIVLAGFVAVVLHPAVSLLERRARLPVPLAILVVYLAILLAISGLALLFVPPVVEQGTQLAEDLPGYVQDLRDNERIRDLDERYDLTGKLQEQAESFVDRLDDAAGALQSIAAAIVNAAFQLITVATLAFLLLLRGEQIGRFVLAVRGPHHERRYVELAIRMYRSTAGYVAGVFTIATVNGLSALIVLSVLGVPFAVPLAVLMGAFGLIPMVGATIGAVIVGVVTAFHDFPTATLVWVVYSILYQQLENNLLQPIVYRRTVNVPPLMVIVSVLVLATLLGVFGALVAIPVAAAVQIVARDVWARRGGSAADELARGRADPEQSGPDVSADDGPDLRDEEGL